jgi:hypothetical protein
MDTSPPAGLDSPAIAILANKRLGANASVLVGSPFTNVTPSRSRMRFLGLAGAMRLSIHGPRQPFGRCQKISTHLCKKLTIKYCLNSHRPLTETANGPMYNL